MDKNKKMKLIKGLSIISVMLLLASCSLEKRHYMSGISVNWETNKHNQPGKDDENDLFNSSENKNSSETSITEKDNYSLTASDDSIPVIISKKYDELNFNIEDTCDIIELRDKTTIRAKIKEIGASQLKYKRCDNINGPDYIIDKSDLTSITFSNGTKEIFDKTPEHKTEPKINKK